MKKRLFISFGFFLLCFLQSMAREVLFNTIRFEIDDAYRTDISADGPYKAIRDSSFIMIKKVSFPSKSYSEKNRGMDTIVYPFLKDCELILFKNEPFYKFTKDYVIKEYRCPQGEMYITYATYTSSKKAYCGLAKYTTKDEKASILKTYQSISANLKPFKELFLSYMNAPYYWMAYVFIFFFLGVFSKGEVRSVNKKLLFSCVLISLPILIFAIGLSWPLIVFVILAETFFFAMGAIVSP